MVLAQWEVHRHSIGRLKERRKERLNFTIIKQLLVLSSAARAPQSPRDGSGLRFQQPHTPPSSSNPHTPASPHPIGQNHPNFNMTSPPGPHMHHPSPSAGIMPSSPLNPQPSPMAHSPGPNMGYMQSHAQDNSPFTSALSPGVASNWPGSPMPRPSPRPGQSPEHKMQHQRKLHACEHRINMV